MSVVPIEPGANLKGQNAQTCALFSIAISMKRIADTLESGKAIFDPFAPTNPYGEGLSEGIQNAIVRGQRGISTLGD